MEEIGLLVKGDRVFVALEAIPPVIGAVSYYTLRLSDEPDSLKRKTYRKKIKPLLKKLVKKAKKLAIHHSDACRVAGTGYWFLGRQRRALALWQEGSRVAGRRGAACDGNRPTPFRSGKPLQDP